MDDFIPGQRWISETEVEMGLGTVLDVDQRTVKMVFLATGETRVYARQTAPLVRARFSPGDQVQSHEGWSLLIEKVEEHNGLLHYAGTREDGSREKLEEGQLDNFIQLSSPADRLFTGQIDQNKLFELRYRTRLQLNRLSHSDLRGLAGGRTSLIPHQLYIAHEVANRYAPRVLLADEVGLGKTIEAGLILHHQLLTERAKRVLIVVPESLVHQWLVEMLRKFNLYFSIFDEERCQAIDESSTQENPFQTEQLVLCHLEFLVHHPERFQQALEGEWDLLIVDEAHHLQWSPQQASPEYKVVEKLAETTKGVLLLTATPEQLGKESHFARLRLLDPDRFPDFETYLKEEQSYEPVARTVETLLTDQPVDNDSLAVLQGTLQEGDNRNLLDLLLHEDSNNHPENQHARRQLVEHLLDRHGTGRVLFRNTRAAVKGFPGRELYTYPLPVPEPYAECFVEFQSSSVDPQILLCPELLYQSITAGNQIHWTLIDPRVDWLIAKLKSLKPEKVLIITASARTALDLSQALKQQTGILTAVFHEGLSIVERDRAAAFFADREKGCQALICSEIGSEGRNFQFAHHLILFDLPLNPDLLEQRIGRLDRIGQTDTIQIHVPFLENSPQSVILDWYHHGLSAFEQTCPAGHTVFVQVRSELIDALHQFDTGMEDLPALVNTTQKLYRELNDSLHRGRDRLLEYNSCRQPAANQLKQRIQQEDMASELLDYMDHVFDAFGVDSEEHRENSYIIHPGTNMLQSFPGLPEDGMTFTCNRNTALANEDIHYLTWEHPMVGDAMDMIVSSETGNTAFTTVNYNAVKPGSILLECLYILESASNATLQTSRYLPTTLIRIITDQQGNNHASNLSFSDIRLSEEIVDTETASKIIHAYNQVFRDMIAHSEKLANRQAPEILASAREQMNQTLTGEINRLKALRQVNPNVREDEIRYFELQLQNVNRSLESARPRLDALRVMIAT